MLAVFDSMKHSEVDLLRAINGGCFSHAYAGGIIDASAVWQYYPVAIDQQAAPEGLDVTSILQLDDTTPHNEPLDAETTSTTDNPDETTDATEPAKSTRPAPLFESDLMAKGLHMPDIFFTLNGSLLYQWVGVRENQAVVREDSEEANR